MQRFTLRGHYSYVEAPHGRGDLEGHILVDDHGVFEGRVYDHASSSPHQIIKGHLRHHDGATNLVFLKFPPANNLANLAYVLETPPRRRPSFEGTYRGRWEALPVKIQFNPKYNLLVAQIDPYVGGIGDAAEIDLRKE